MNISKRQFDQAVTAACRTIKKTPAPKWFRDGYMAPKVRAAFAAVGIRVGKEAQP